MLILYGTEGCQLCDEALALVLAEPQLVGWALDSIDIAFDEQLLATYAERIPVLVNGAHGAALDWPFDATALSAFVAAQLQ